MSSSLLPLGRQGRGDYHAVEDGFVSGRASPAFGAPDADEKDDSATLLDKDQFRGAKTTGAKSKDADFTESFRFSHRSQFLRLLWTTILPRWLVSVVLCVLIFAHLWVSQRFDMGGDGRHQWSFTAGVLALAILLAANAKSVGIQCFRLLRWRTLARRAHTKQEVDAILVSGNGWGAILWASWIRGRKLRLLSSLATLVTLAGLMVAVLCTSAVEFLYTFERSGASGAGNSLRANFKHIYYGAADANVKGSPSNEVQYLSGHLYGDMSFMSIDGLPQSPMWDGKPALIPKPSGDKNKHAWSYFFRETNPARSRWQISKTSIESSAECSHYPIVSGQLGDSDTLTYLNGTTRTTLYNLQRFAPDATVWANARSDVSPWSFCGPRCARVFTFQYVDPAQDESKSEGDMFDCYITLSAMVGMPDEVASIFAGSIGLRGFVSTNDKWQYTRYSKDTFWGEKFGKNATAAAYKASRFAIGAVAMADVLGPREGSASPSSSEWQDLVLTVYWRRVAIVLPALLAIHLVIALTTLSFANSVIIPSDSSALAISKLLRPVHHASSPIERFVYGIQMSPQSETAHGEDRSMFHRILIGKQSEVTARFRFPAGWYEI